MLKIVVRGGFDSSPVYEKELRGLILPYVIYKGIIIKTYHIRLYIAFAALIYLKSFS